VSLTLPDRSSGGRDPVSGRDARERLEWLPALSLAPRTLAFRDQGVANATDRSGVPIDQATRPKPEEPRRSGDAGGTSARPPGSNRMLW
jgi:hypothetical protein